LSRSGSVAMAIFTGGRLLPLLLYFDRLLVDSCCGAGRTGLVVSLRDGGDGGRRCCVPLLWNAVTQMIAVGSISLGCC
jgi:hypothetical protein